MSHLRCWACIGLIGGAVLLPAVASAQSALAGRVADATGSVLPGVTVEAASPALIERTRVAVTNSDGRYTVTDLRPGLYTVTFSLAGFSTVRREGIQLPADTTATVNAELSVGAVEETITVTGAAPVVDVQRASRTAVITRDVADVLPTSRDFKALAATLPGVKTNKQNVGGTRLVNPQAVTALGASGKNTTKYIDGLSANTAWSDGRINIYDNDAMAAETSYSLSSAAADTGGGGLRINIIPVDGGNAFKGVAFVSYIPGQWQSNNVTQALIDRGLRGSDRIEYITDLNVSGGGPIMRDRVWFFASYRRQSTDAIKPNTFFADGRPGHLFTDGRPGHETNYNNNYSGRVTAQVTPRNKLAGYLDWNRKVTPRILTPGNDPDTSYGVRYPTKYYIGQAKWTSTLSSRTLIETGVSLPVMMSVAGYSEEQKRVPFTPEWYAAARKEDIVLGTAWNGYLLNSSQDFHRWNASSSVSYVTGSHSFKTGAQFSRARHTEGRTVNAELIQRYRNGVPDSVVVSNGPSLSNDFLKADLGVYAMDTWTMGRLTVNPGIRFQWLNGAIGASDVPAGRFVGERHFAAVANVPDWFDVTPRFSAAYDLFGDSRTALKVGVNKYMEVYVTSFSERYNPMVQTTDIRNWQDLNHDDIAQDNEIGPSNNIYFGTRPTRNPAADLKRDYTMEYSVSIQHQLFPGVAVTGDWYRRTFHNMHMTDNLLIAPSDYVPFDVVNPLTGEVFTAYNLKREKQGLINQLDTNSRDPNKRGRTYDAANLTANVRLENGIAIYGGWTMARDVAVACDGDDPNTFRFCDQRGLIPFRHDFKVSGGYPLPWDLQLGFSFQSYAGATAVGTQSDGDGSLKVNWNIPASLFPGGRVQTAVVPLIPPGTKYPPRHNQLDLSMKRTFRLGSRGTIQPTVSLFNALNGNNVFDEVQDFGPALGRPNEILQGRLIQVAAHVKF